MTEVEIKAEEDIKNFVADLKQLQINFTETALRGEIEGGFFGVKVQEIFSTLTQEEQNLILRALRLQEKFQGRRLMFRLAVQSLFPKSKIYFNAGKWLMYLPEKKSDLIDKKIELIKILFMDFSNAKIDLYFEKSFGVFGEPETMLLDNLVLI